MNPITVLLTLAAGVVAVSGAGLLIPALGIAAGTTAIAGTLASGAVISAVNDSQEVRKPPAVNASLEELNARLKELEDELNKG